MPLPPLARSPFPVITGKALGNNGIIASPVYGGSGERSEPIGGRAPPFSMPLFHIAHHFVHAHGARMLRMAPLMLISMDEPEEDDRYPRIDEHRIEEQIEPRLQLGTYLDEDNHGQKILPDHDRRHQLRRQEFINARIERRECQLHVTDDDEQRRDHEEVRLEEIDASVPDADVLPAPSLLERERLLIVDHGVMRPRRLDALGKQLHRELHVLGEAGRAPAVPLQHVRRNAHARTAEARRETDVRLCEMRNMVDDPKRNRKRPCHPCVVWILRIQIALNDLVALEEAVVHLLEEIRVYEVVRIEDSDGIVLLVHRKELLKHPLKGKPLALLRRMRARADNGARLLRDLPRIVRTVVRNDIDVVQFLGIVEPLQIFDELPDDRRLVVRGDDDSKRLLRRQDFFLPMPPQTAEADEEKIGLLLRYRRSKLIGKGKEDVEEEREIPYVEIKKALVIIKFK